MLITLTIAGSDSLGGAGIEADIKAMASLGAHPAVALTAITAQNSQSVSCIYPLPTYVIDAQIDAVLTDAKIDAVKIGMLYSPEIVETVAYKLKSEKFPIVLDPVLVSGVGDSLKTGDLAQSIAEKMLPISTIITPNIPEAEELTGMKITDLNAVDSACKKLYDLGAESVLIKGGHLKGPCIDTLYSGGKVLRTKMPRVPIRGHGGGCILSSLIAVNAAKGMSVWESYLRSKIILDNAIKLNYPVGKGVPAISPLVNTYLDSMKFSSQKSKSNNALR